MQESRYLPFLYDEDYETKILCILVVDSTFSMRGDAISEANRILHEFIHDLQSDEILSKITEISIVSCGDEVRTIQEVERVENISIPTLVAYGECNLETSIYYAMQLVEDRKKWYRDTFQTYYRPCIMLFTNGGSFEECETSILARCIKKDVQDRKYCLLPIGVDKPNMDVLKNIAYNDYVMQYRDSGILVREINRVRMVE